MSTREILHGDYKLTRYSSLQARNASIATRAITTNAYLRIGASRKASTTECEDGLRAKRRCHLYVTAPSIPSTDPKACLEIHPKIDGLGSGGCISVKGY